MWKVKKGIGPFVAALLLLWPLLLPAVTPGQYAAIQRLGELNGVALHCGYLLETRRMKEALVQVLPKRRQLGQAFEDHTNRAFLEFIETGAKCPGEEPFIREVDGAIRQLETAFQD